MGTKIKIGDKVMVFKDPLTREVKEGFAIVKEVHSIDRVDDETRYSCAMGFPNSAGSLSFRLIVIPD